jgi:23S rRNA (cytidine1920-2'-O)/16S rRNA (cytidine1409-2'-O)-methyltransferase
LKKCTATGWYHALHMAEPCPYVSRGGLKLAAALDHFNVDPAGRLCADLGCNVGGFTDCLLQRGARHVWALDTGYGELAWKLRQDARVGVHERTNALHTTPADIAGARPCSLVVIDMGWTRQALAVPAALAWLDGNDPTSSIITLIKPHYEADRPTLARGRSRGVLADEDAQRLTDAVVAALPGLGVKVQGVIPSPIRGGAGKGKTGNVEYLAHLTPVV